MTLSFSCNQMCLFHVNSAWMILCKFLASNCAIFPNTNLVEIILPQSLDRFWTVVYSKFFMVNWMGSMTERIQSSGMIKCECIRCIFISSQISSFCDCQTKFSKFPINPHWVKRFLTKFTFASATSYEGNRASKTVVNIYANFLFLSSPKVLPDNA